MYLGRGLSPTSVGVKYRGGRPAACVVFIGFVSHFLGFHRSGAGQIGFVSHFSRVDRVVVGVDWVRFA